MTTNPSSHPDHEPTVDPPLSQFDRRGVAAPVAGDSIPFLRFFALGVTVLVTVSTFDNLDPDLIERQARDFLNPAYLIPLAMLAIAGLLSWRRVRIRLDADSGAVVWDWSLLVPYRSRREPIDLSTVREVRLRSGRCVVSYPSFSLGSQSTSRSEVVTYAASLEGTSPPAAYGCCDYGWTRSVAEHFALGLGVPLRLSEDDVRAPEEIYAPLRDRLARRLLPAPVPLPAGQGRLSAVHDAAAGTTRIKLPKGADAVLVIVGETVFPLILMTMVMMVAMAVSGYVSVPAVSVPAVWVIPAVLAIAVVWFRVATSAVVTVLADGGLEVVRRFPIGRQTRRIAGDALNDVTELDDPSEALVATGRRRSLRFGLGLDADERRWLERALHLAIARRSRVACVQKGSDVRF